MYNYFIERCDNCVILSGEQLQLLWYYATMCHNHNLMIDWFMVITCLFKYQD